jgi:hypothetical protein
MFVRTSGLTASVPKSSGCCKSALKRVPMSMYADAPEAMHVHSAKGREISVHGFQGARLFGDGINGGYDSIHWGADGNQQLVEGVDRRCGFAVDRLSYGPDAHLGIERDFDRGD